MNIGVYGMGRFGAFWARHLAAIGEVYAYNRSEGRQYPDSVRHATLEELVACDVIVLCVAISAFKDVVGTLASVVRPGTLVMDTCSVKKYPAAVMESLLPASVSIIATHPMFGPDSGKDGIAGLPMVYCPIRCDEALSASWKAKFESMQLNVLEMDCDRHDKEAAYSQGVTHFVGRVLDELQLNPTELSTLGYKNLMSIVEQTCNDPIQLFYDLQRFNPYAHAMHTELKRALDAVISALDQQDSSGWKRS